MGGNNQVTNDLFSKASTGAGLGFLAGGADGSYNELVFASAGSGMSVLAALQQVQLARDPAARVAVLDVGLSSARLLKEISGE